MALFQKSVLRKFLKDIDNAKLQGAWQLFKGHFHNPDVQKHIRDSKEEEYQEGFVRDLFVNVLGYTLKPQPNYNFVLEKKTEADATKSDGAMLRAEAVIGVIELKDTDTTELDSIEKQVFGYKHKHKNCVYVITSNFEKLRFYINDSIDHEEFNLFDLTENGFALLYLCLQQKNIENDIPLKIKQASVAEEEGVTKKLYAEYSTFKRQLFTNIAELNPKYNKLELFKKTQKLLDRFLFILFAEDRLLVPPNSVRVIIADWEKLKELDNYVPLYNRFKKYFGYLNKGHVGKQYDIYAYNGGLFADDEILDNLKICDKLLYEGTKALSNYDFQSEVDVNILGHIFEHSLSEIEEVQAELEGKAVDKKKTKRKKDGVFYTPRYITKYIVENTVGELCKQKKEELKITDDEFAYRKRSDARENKLKKLNSYRQWLLGLTICDPACGSGAFLNQALEYLIAEHRYIDELRAKLLGEKMVMNDMETEILSHNLFGVDINEEAVEIARLSLWLRTAQKGRKLSDLSKSIKCGNSLIDDPAVASDKAFHWKKEFPDVFEKGGFDVVIGNPPYVRAESFLEIKPFLESRYIVFNGNADLYSYFYEKGMHILKKSGLLCLITANKWIQSNYGNELRQLLSDFRIIEIVDFGELPIFDDASTFPCIITIQKNNLVKKINYREVLSTEEALDVSFRKNYITINQRLLNSDNWILKNENISSLIQRLEKSNVQLGNIFNKFLAGIKTGANDLFIYSKDEVEKITNGDLNEQKLFRPIIFGQDFSKYIITQNKLKYLFFPYEYKNGENKLLRLEDYPYTYDYLKKDEPKFSMRVIIKEGIIKKTHCWYELQQINKFFNYDDSKIIYPDIAKTNRFIFDKDGIIPDMTCFFLPSDKIEYLPLFNSNLFKFLASNYCPILGNIKTGGRIRYKSTYLAKIPFVSLTSVDKTIFIEAGSIMLSKNKELHEAKQILLSLLKSKYDGVKISNKLEDWPSLSFKDFLKEITKQKIKLSLAEQTEWMQHFEKEKAKANAIQQVIDKTDKEIDQMVYELYGLTEEEIKIVGNT